jgi:hypothetical protein
MGKMPMPPKHSLTPPWSLTALFRDFVHKKMHICCRNWLHMNEKGHTLKPENGGKFQ